MEKISQIVRGSSRVAATDLKSSSALRPGTPSFGRPMGESVGPSANVGTTASRAVSLHKELEDKKTSNNSQIVGQMADQFFMTRIRRPIDPSEISDSPGIDLGDRVGDVSVGSSELGEEDSAPPSGYTPRGSYVDFSA